MILGRDALNFSSFFWTGGVSKDDPWQGRPAFFTIFAKLLGAEIWKYWDAFWKSSDDISNCCTYFLNFWDRNWKILGQKPEIWVPKLKILRHISEIFGHIFNCCNYFGKLWNSNLKILKQKLEILGQNLKILGQILKILGQNLERLQLCWTSWGQTRENLGTRIGPSAILGARFWCRRSENMSLKNNAS